MGHSQSCLELMGFINAIYLAWRAYLRDHAELESLGKVMVFLKKAKQWARQDPDALPSSLGAIDGCAHAVRAVMVLASLQLAGGIESKTLFGEAQRRMFPETLVRYIHECSLVEFRAALLGCFEKLLGDVPGAFTSKSQKQHSGARPPRRHR